MNVQWNLQIKDTFGTRHFVLSREDCIGFINGVCLSLSFVGRPDLVLAKIGEVTGET